MVVLVFVVLSASFDGKAIMIEGVLPHFFLKNMHRNKPAGKNA